MSFEQMEKAFKQLKSDFQSGILSESEFKKQLENLMVQDAQGIWWMIGYETELWYRFDGTNWVQADPPSRSLPKSTPAKETKPEIIDNKNVEIITPKPYTYNAGKSWNALEKTIPQETIIQKQPVLIWAIIGVIACLAILTGLGGITLIKSLAEGTETSTPTKTFTPTRTPTRTPSPTRTQTSTATLTSTLEPVFPSPIANVDATTTPGLIDKSRFSFTFGKNYVRNDNCQVANQMVVFPVTDFQEDKWLYFSSYYPEKYSGSVLFWSVQEPSGSYLYERTERTLRDLSNNCFWQGFSVTTSPTIGIYELIVEFNSEIIYRVTFRIE